MSSAQEYLRESQEDLVEENREYWSMSTSEDENLEGLANELVRRFSIDEVLESGEAEVENVRVSRGDPYNTRPESMDGSIVIGLYSERSGPTPKVGFSLGINVDYENGKTVVEIQPETAGSISLSYDSAFSPDQLKKRLEENFQIK